MSRILMTREREDLLVEPVAKAEGPGLLLEFTLDRDHLGVLDFKNARAEGVVESSEPFWQCACNFQVLGNLGRHCVLQCLFIHAMKRNTRVRMT